MNIISLIRNFSYVISSNFISLAISSIAVLIVPKFLGVESYGYWQLYIFYTAYVGVLHLGWLDGIYLRFGGVKYGNLDKRLFNSQFVEFALMQFLIAFGIVIYGFQLTDQNRSFIIIMTAMAMIFVNLGQFCLYILQDTNRIRDYSFDTAIGRIIYFAIVLLLIFNGSRDFRLFIIADLIGRFIAMMYGFYLCKDIVFYKLSRFVWSFKETYKNFAIGINLLIANTANSLIIGIVRYGIQHYWGISIFGKISLTLNISNLLMTFVSAISLVLYPTLRRLDKDKVQNVYVGIRQTLTIILLTGLIAYYPVNYLLGLWLPKYADSLRYMALLFPMCVYSGKFQLLISTFMKILRYERDLLLVNVVSVAFSVIITIINVFFIKSLIFIMISIVFILWIQSNFGEYILGKRMDIKTMPGIWEETLVVVAFISLNWLGKFPVNIILYIVVLIIYILENKSSFVEGLRFLGVK
ncbi:lipopolysaccharide biosynthesis protein [Lentilactobacillus buchneri]|uniref:lipopolysaccharide biosynthesis protein n=1 Tax=Lentilactobacillus buchneri TaxID=1581 RepID=UPI0021A43515|nr:hypothetical protein [Lentilactobacillus buchneri]MCT3551754.1 hypothetical protein [Lentilactobacillus buchneri]